MKILVAIDGSAASMQALHHVLGLLHGGLRASLVLGNVQQPPSLYEVVAVHDVAGIEAMRAAAGADLLAAAEALVEARGCDYESEVAGGAPQHVLVEMAERYGAASIVLGAQGMGTRPGVGLGSVVLDVLAHSKVPVTVVPLPAFAADA
jgi:nucleotide-binding universal stress UspA family protein